MSADRRSPLGKSFSQHRLRSLEVARRIVAHTGLAPPSLVLEAGAGRGMLTRALAEVAGSVVAIEKDPVEFESLTTVARDLPNVRPVLADFLTTPLPRRPYHVVANLPFSITAPALRRLTTAPNPPRTAHLIVERDAALHWAGIGRESLVSVLTKVRFEMHIALALRRRDFEPWPACESVLLRLRLRPTPILSRHSAAAVERFVSLGFMAGRRTVGKNLERTYDQRRLHRVADIAGADLRVAPGELPFSGWLALFETLHNDAGPARRGWRARAPDRARSVSRPGR